LTRRQHDGVILSWVWRICEVLHSHFEGISVTQLTMYARTNYVTIMPFLKLMEQKQFITMTEAKGRCGRTVQITEHGEELLSYYRAIKRLLK
jgi:predicted transcriptional regulator